MLAPARIGAKDHISAQVSIDVLSRYLNVKDDVETVCSEDLLV